MINSVILEGRLTKKPELKFHGDDDCYTYFNLAVPRSYLNANKERDADFILCLAWGKVAEIVVNYLDKGRLCGVQGRLQVSRKKTVTGLLKLLSTKCIFSKRHQVPKSKRRLKQKLNWVVGKN